MSVSHLAKYIFRYSIFSHVLIAFCSSVPVVSLMMNTFVSDCSYFSLCLICFMFLWWHEATTCWNHRRDCFIHFTSLQFVRIYVSNKPIILLWSCINESKQFSLSVVCKEHTVFQHISSWNSLHITSDLTCRLCFQYREDWHHGNKT